MSPTSTLDPGADANDAARMALRLQNSIGAVAVSCWAVSFWAVSFWAGSFRAVSVGAIVAVTFAGGCAGDKGQAIPDRPQQTSTPARAAPLEGAPVMAVQSLDAPGYNVNDLTARLRDALIHTSGVVVVDELSVRAEIAACVEMPCKDVESERFKAATLIANATLSRVGTTLLGSVRIQAGLKELVRVNAQGTDAGAVIQQLGFEAGQKLRDVLSPESPIPQNAPSEER